MQIIFGRAFKLATLIILGFAICVAPSHFGPSLALSTPVDHVSQSIEQERQGKRLYQINDFEQAALVWQQAAQAYQENGDQLSQARVLSNLSLAYQQLGRWEAAREAVTDSLEFLLIKTESKLSIDQTRVLAQALNTLGRLQLATGQTDQALQTWQRATDAYTQAQNEQGVLQSQVNQAEALQGLGFTRRALNLLTQVNQVLKTQPPSHLKAVALGSWGELLALTGEFEEADAVLEQSLAVAQQLSDPDDIATALLNLGNTARAQQNYQKALSLYQRAAAIPALATTKIAVNLAKFSLFLDQKQWQAVEALWTVIQSQLADTPTSHATIYSQINFALSLIHLKQAEAATGLTLTNSPAWQTIAANLARSVQQAKDLGDRRALSYGQGALAQIYEQTQQWSVAQALTEQALQLAQEVNAPEIIYRWQWQLGRIFNAQGYEQKAIAAYSEAVTTLKSLRGDLVAVSPDVQFSFRNSIEPIYRELVSLLLRTEEVEPQKLEQAREIVESLRVAELDNFLRQACLTAQPVPIDQLDPQAAIVYPIILSDRLEVILSLPDSPLRHYTTPVSEVQLEEGVRQLRQTLVIRSRRQFLDPAQTLYDWLIRPMVADLATAGINTLVFVPDGSLRNIPMAALHDGQQYLIEQYKIAVTPGLQLLPPGESQTSLKTLAAGLTTDLKGFAALNYVQLELTEIQETVPKSVILLNQEFTQASLHDKIEFSNFPIVHIATHGQFSSSLDQTFILAWDSRINISELNDILQARRPGATAAIDLLVLSACETATGDKRAALGLAGTAVQAGARSTAATLWAVNDEATALLMGQFYQELTNQGTKAEALRQAQLALLKNPWYRHPFYWAPYILVGNWL